MKRSLNFWVEPDQAFKAKKEGHVLLLSEGAVGREDYAIAVLDVDRGKIVWSKTLDDLFPSRKKEFSPQWSGSMSSKSWIAKAEIDEAGQCLVVTTERPEQTGFEKAAPFENASVITVDLENFAISIALSKGMPEPGA